MKTILFAVGLMFNWLYASADISFHYYNLTGIVMDSKNRIYINAELYITQGDFRKRVRTDNDGKYKVKAYYLKPCLGGGGNNYKDTKMLDFANQYNGSELKVYIPSKNIVLSEEATWLDYYLGNKKASEITQLNFNFENSSIIDSLNFDLKRYKVTNEQTKQAFLAMASRRIDNITDFQYQIKDLEFIIGQFEFINQTLEFFLERTNIKKSDLVLSKNNESIWVYSVGDMGFIHKTITIQLSKNNLIENIRMRYN